MPDKVKKPWEKNLKVEESQDAKPWEKSFVVEKKKDGTQSSTTPTSIPQKTNGASGTTVGSSGTPKFRLAGEKQKLPKETNSTYTLKPNSTEVVQSVEDTVNQAPNKNLEVANKAYDYALNNIDKSISEKRYNDEVNNYQFLDGVKQGLKNFYNTAVVGPANAINSLLGTKPLEKISQYKPLEKELKEAKKQLQEELGPKATITNEQIQQKAKDIFIQNDVQEQMHSKIDEFLPSDYDREGIWKELKLKELNSNALLKSKVVSAEVFKSQLEEFQNFAKSMSSKTPTEQDVLKYNELKEKATFAVDGLNYLAKNFDNYLKEAKTDGEKLELFKYNYDNYEKNTKLLWGSVMNIAGGSVKLLAETSKFVENELGLPSIGTESASALGSEVLNDAKKMTDPFYKYKATKLNSWSDLGSYASQLASEQIPILASIYLGGTGGVAGVSMSSGGQKINELEEQEKQPFGKKYSDGEKLTAGWLYAGAEFIPEKLGTARILKDMERTISYASSASRRLFRDSFMTETKNGLKKFAYYSGLEGSTEYLTAEAQIKIDESLLNIVNTDFENNERRAESFFAGAGMGGGMSIAGGALGFATSQAKLYSESKDIKEVQSILSNIDKINLEIENNPLLTEKEVADLYKEMNSLSNKAFETISKNANKGAEFSVEEKSALLDINLAQNDLKAKFKEIQNSNFSKDIKKGKIDELNNEFNSLEQRRNAILKGEFSTMEKPMEKPTEEVVATPEKTQETATQAQEAPKSESNLERLQQLPITDENAYNEAISVVESIDFNDEKSIEQGISNLANTIAGKDISATKQSPENYIRSKEKLIGNDNFKSKEYLEEYVNIIFRDFSNNPDFFNKENEGNLPLETTQSQETRSEVEGNYPQNLTDEQTARADELLNKAVEDGRYQRQERINSGMNPDEASRLGYQEWLQTADGQEYASIVGQEQIQKDLEGYEEKDALKNNENTTFYTGRKNKFEDLTQTKGEFIFFSKNPEVSSWYGGDETNVSEANIDTSNFLDLTTQEKKAKFVEENFTEKDIYELYPKIIDSFVFRTDKLKWVENKLKDLRNEFFSADNAEQKLLLKKIKEKGFSGVALLDAFFGNKDISYVVIDKNVIKTKKNEKAPTNNTPANGDFQSGDNRVEQNGNTVQQNIAPESLQTTNDTGNTEAEIDFALKQIESGVLNWNGNINSPRINLDMSWADIRKGEADLKRGKYDSVPAKRLLEAFSKAKEQGGYEYKSGTGGENMRTKEFVSFEDIQKTINELPLTDAELEEINQNTESLAIEYDNYFNSLDEQSQLEILENYEGQEINPTEAIGNTNAGKSENDAQNQEVSAAATEPTANRAEREVTEDGKEKKKSLLNRAYKGENDETLKEKIAEYGLNYREENQDKAKNNAFAFVGSVGIEQAHNALKQGLVKGAERAFVYQAITDLIAKKIESAKGEDKIPLLEDYAEVEASLFNDFDLEARDAGRFISALNKIYNESEDINYSLERQNAKYKAANKGEISAEVLAKFKEADKTIKELNKKIKALEEKTALLREQGEFDIFEETLAKSRESKNRGGLTESEQKRKKQIARKYFGTFNDVTRFAAVLAEPEFREYLGLTLKEAKGNLEYFAKKILKELGKGAEKHLPELTRVAKEIYENNLKKSIKLDEDGKLTIPANLLYDLIQKGFKNFNSLSEEVHKMLIEENPDLDIREVKETISGYIKESTKKKSDIEIELSKIKRLGRLELEIEDLRKGIVREKSIKRRDKLSEKETALKAQKKQLELDLGITESKRIENTKQFLKKRTEELKKRISEGDFVKKEIKPIAEDAELKQLRAQKAQQQEIFDKERYKAELNNQTNQQILLEGLKNLLSIPKILAFTIDLSFVGIQGGLQTYRMLVKNPKLLGSTIKKTLRVMADAKKESEYESLVKSDPDYDLMKKAKLGLTESHYKMTAKEELFQNNAFNLIFDYAADKLEEKGFKKAGNVVRNYINFFKIFERGQTFYLNQVRLYRFKEGMELLKLQGLNEIDHLDQYKSVAAAVNTMTGRANTDGKVLSSLRDLNGILFSSFANWKSIINQFNPIWYYNLTPTARKMVMTDLMRYTVATSGIIALMVLSSDDDEEKPVTIEFDPRSSDFGLLKIGNMRVDPWGTRKSHVVFMSRILTKSVKNKDGEIIDIGVDREDRNAMDVFLSYTRGKISPGVSMLLKYAFETESKEEDGVKFREDKYGRDFNPIKDIVPLYIQSFNEVNKENPALTAAFINSIAYFGFANTNIYGEDEVVKDGIDVKADSETESSYVIQKPK